MTKREVLTILLASDNTDVVDYATKELALIDAKNTKAAARRAAKAKTADALTNTIQGLLTATPTSISDIATAASTTNAKAQYRLNELVKAGVAVKSTIKVDKRTVTVFSLVD